MAKQCEDLGKGTRKKLSNWLAQETQYARGADKFLPAIPASGCPAVEQVSMHCQFTALRLRITIIPLFATLILLLLSLMVHTYARQHCSNIHNEKKKYLHLHGMWWLSYLKEMQIQIPGNDRNGAY